jgi:ATP-dependent Clp protease ATP-binding subunit ClpC
MFERYTEKARRIIFFARYEASQFGAEQIETEHILLGLMREDRSLAGRFFNQSHHHAHTIIESIREEIRARTMLRERTSISVDLPLSVEAKQALAFAAEESTQMGHRHIGPEHLLLGILRAENSLAAKILFERGLRLSELRSEIQRQTEQQATGRLEMRPEEAQPADRDEKWLWAVSEACTDLGLFGQDELLDEFQRVAALRQFRVDAEALLRLLAAKGLVGSPQLVRLAFELRDEKRLQEFISRLRGQAGEETKE